VADPRRLAVPLDACLEWIREIEPSIHAWVRVEPQPAVSDGPLSGVPFGVKDIIDTGGLATEYGSPLYAGRMPAADAAIVARLRGLGAILVGKTQTTAFAYRTPAPTRNPHQVAHTPGGSSSGSAAAVAAGMVPLALGTQTQGSILRPASYCGVTGFKPSYGVLSLDGVLPFAVSLDTLGLFTATPAEMIVVWQALGYETGAAQDLNVAVPDPLPDVEAPMAEAFRAAVARLAAAGVRIARLDLAAMLDSLAEASTTVMAFEGARFHQSRYQEHGERIGGHLASLVRAGLAIDQPRYDAARRAIETHGAAIAAYFDASPIVLVPAATGPAPFGLESTGDARMNSPWTALGTPAISIPMPVDGLPLGLQVVGRAGDDARVLRAAARLHDLLHER
jgi:Asp-tRNA(Asn)/Glu-tRNA(Gln) amidotransferase A subunit family amidase